MLKFTAENVKDALLDISLYSAPHVDSTEIAKSVERAINLDKLAVSLMKCCTYCSANFADTTEQRAHYKSDWHRYNLKQALFGRPSITSEAFDKLSDDLSSISGSESESSSDEEQEKEDSVQKQFNIRDAKIFWKNSMGDVFSVYKCLLLGRRETGSSADLKESLLKIVKLPHKWLVVMLGGGHFAAAIFDGSSVVVHKTFHCYTVRAKQGGSQSSKDNKGSGHAKSAGASLRRYNELALIQHVQDIMTSWAEEIAGCSLLLYRAVGPHNRAVLFGGKRPPINKADPRLRAVPFPTRRATFKEVKRIHDLLTTVNSHGSAEDFETNLLTAQDNKAQNSPSKRIETESKSPQFDRGKERATSEREIPGQQSDSESDSDGDNLIELLTNDVEIDFSGLKETDNSIKKKKRRRTTARKRTNLEKRRFAEAFDELRGRLVSCCQKGDTETLRAMIADGDTWHEDSNETVDAPRQPDKLSKKDFRQCLEEAFGDDQDTLLHIAASSCHPSIVSLLLVSGCLPTIKNRKKLVPYVLSGDKATKNAFKDFVAEYPDKFDLKLSMIPLPLSEEEERLQKERRKEIQKQKKEREKMKKKLNEQKKIDEDEKIRFLALSDREKRAVAAERRLLKSSTANNLSGAAPVLVRCFLCGVNMTGKVPFEYNCQVFCTVQCLKQHRTGARSGATEH